MRNWRWYLCVVVLCSMTLTLQAQVEEELEDIDINMLDNMSPEQLQFMLQLAINSLPESERQEVNENLRFFQKEVPETISTAYKAKTITFIPIAHAAQPVFYDNLKDLIVTYKKRGYTVYYEQVKTQKTAPVDTVRLKARKMKGMELNRDTYGIMSKFFPNIISQPLYKDLGIDSTDINADVSMADVVKEYERLYGPIALSPCDFETPFDNLNYTCGVLQNDLNPVFLTYRNEALAKYIKSSKDKKILVIYGAKHVDGVLALLKQ
jgi:hypothetical protein